MKNHYAPVHTGNLYVHMIMSLLLFIAACKKNDPPPTLSADQTTFDIPAAGDQVKLKIKANVNWKITLPDWITADKLSGLSNDSLQLTIAENTTEAERTATVRVEATNNSTAPAITITIRQKKYGYTTEWQQQFTLKAIPWVVGAIAMDDGCTIVAGATHNMETQHSESFVLKINADGTEAWRRFYPEAYFSSKNTLAAGPDGVLLLWYNQGNKATYLRASDGGTAWEASLTGIDADYGTAAVRADDGYKIAGIDNSNHSNLVVQNLSNNGVFTARNTYAGYDGWFIGMAIAPDKSLAILTSASRAVEITTINAAGVHINKHRYTGADGVYYEAAGIAVAPDGSVLVAGYEHTAAANDNNILLMKVNADGTRAWTKSIGGAGFDWGTSVVAMPDGFWASGSIYPTSAWTGQFTYSGNKRWEQTFTIPGAQDNNDTYLAPVANGAILVHGTGPAVWIARLKAL
ncbi:hypothetical protein HB364_23420 [Pseudoflavitalea sp. X16]|uniref:BACON domain-containing protein n=1 Tax=Paraflavitalea devenefica TaxID=2716334 RepID=UPI0014227884|nr:BACON domain-containing carbohydrate-binding protein [Paraflavitalea devenefica]NII28054.1 hypothetical protein [Paraflavitalea devenefica]